MNNSSDRRPTLDDWIDQFTKLTNRYPSGSDIEDAINQGIVRTENRPDTGLTPPIQARPAGERTVDRKAFSIVAITSLVVAFISLWLPVASSFGVSIGWFDDELSGEGILLLVAILLSAVFVGSHMIVRSKGLKITASIVSTISGVFLVYDGFTNLSGLGQFGGPGLLLMGIAGLGLIIAAIGILATE